jgi:hypothetical protein
MMESSLLEGERHPHGAVHSEVVDDHILVLTVAAVSAGYHSVTGRTRGTCRRRAYGSSRVASTTSTNMRPTGYDPVGEGSIE